MFSFDLDICIVIGPRQLGRLLAVVISGAQLSCGASRRGACGGYARGRAGAPRRRDIAADEFTFGWCVAACNNYVRVKRRARLHSNHFCQCRSGRCGSGLDPPLRERSGLLFTFIQNYSVDDEHACASCVQQRAACYHASSCAKTFAGAELAEVRKTNSLARQTISVRGFDSGKAERADLDLDGEELAES